MRANLLLRRGPLADETRFAAMRPFDRPGAEPRMTGITQDGQAVDYGRRRAQARVPSGPLAPHQVLDAQFALVRGLRQSGYTNRQIAQVLNCSEATIDRRISRRPFQSTFLQRV